MGIIGCKLFTYAITYNSGKLQGIRGNFLEERKLQASFGNLDERAVKGRQRWRMKLQAKDMAEAFAEIQMDLGIILE